MERELRVSQDCFLSCPVERTVFAVKFPSRKVTPECYRGTGTRLNVHGCVRTGMEACLPLQPDACGDFN